MVDSPDNLNQRGREICPQVWLNQLRPDLGILTVEKAASGKHIDEVLETLEGMVRGLDPDKRLRLIVDTSNFHVTGDVFSALGATISISGKMEVLRQIDMRVVAKAPLIATLMNNLTKFPVFPIKLEGIFPTLEEAMNFGGPETLAV